MPMNGIDYVGTSGAPGTSESLIFDRLVVRTNEASRDNGSLDIAELRTLFSNLGMGTLTDSQLNFLLKTYGDGYSIEKTDVIETMANDNVLIARVIQGSPLHIEFALALGNIRGDRLVDPLWRELVSLSLRAPNPSLLLPDSHNRISWGQFAFALDSLTGRLAAGRSTDGVMMGQSGLMRTTSGNGLSADQVQALVAHFGNGQRNLAGDETISKADMRAMFDSDQINIGYLNSFSGVTVSANPIGVTTVSEAVNFIMRSYDGSYDGVINQSELAEAIYDLRDIEAPLDDAVVQQFMAFYGRNMTVNGQNVRVVNKQDVERMFADRALTVDIAIGKINVNLNIAPVERVVHGGSLDDASFDKNELFRLFQTLGVSGITLEKAQFLVHTFGDGNAVSEADILGAMRTEGVLTLNGLGTASSVDFSKISADRIGRAVIREGIWLLREDQRAGKTDLTTAQFIAGMNRVFGRDALTASRGALLVRMFGNSTAQLAIGQGGRNTIIQPLTVNAAQVSTMFSRGNLTMRNLSNSSAIALGFDMKENSQRTDGSLNYITNYFRSFHTPTTLRDRGETLTLAEFRNGLNGYKAEKATVNDSIVQLVSRLFNGAGQSENTISMSEIYQLFSTGVLTLGTGAEQGFKLNLGSVPTELLVDVAFVQAGQTPSTGTINAAQLRRGLATSTGRDSLTDADVNYLAQYFGTAATSGGRTTYSLSRAQVLYIFSSGTLSRPAPGANSNIVLNKTFQSGQLPAHHQKSWWNSAIKFVEGEISGFLSDIKKLTTWGESQIANVLSGRMTAAELVAANANGLMKDIARGAASADRTIKQAAHKVLDSVHKAVTSAIDDISAVEKKAADFMLKEAKELGTEMAVTTLHMLTGMSSADAKKYLAAAGNFGELHDHISNLSYDDIVKYVPGLEGLVREAQEIADLLSGKTVSNPSQKLMAARAAGTESQYVQTFWDKQMRGDLTLELIDEQLVPNAMMNAGALSGRLMLVMPRFDKDGDMYIQLRVRFLDAAGIGNPYFDMGPFGAKDLIGTFYTGKNRGHKNSMDYVSTSGLLAEGYINADLINYIKGTSWYRSLGNVFRAGGNNEDPGEIELPMPPREGTQPTNPAERAAAQQVSAFNQVRTRIVQWMKDNNTGETDIEYGGGVGISATYNLLRNRKDADGKYIKNSNGTYNSEGLGWKVLMPVAFELAGGAAGAMLGFAIANEAGAATSSGIIAHIGADLGVLLGDTLASLSMHEISSMNKFVSMEGNAFFWIAMKNKLIYDKYPEDQRGFGFKLRTQLNFTPNSKPLQIIKART